MGRTRRKKGKSARRARQGLLGLSATALDRKRPKQFEKRVNRRLDQKDEHRTEEILRENIVGQRPEQEPRAPHAFVIHSGRVGRQVRQLEADLRRVMSPNTSKALRVLKRNKLKDFVVHSQFLGVSHLVVLSRTSLSTHLRIIRNPQGPTLHFRVEKYSLARDILSIQKRPVIYEELFQHAPLVVMNGFGGEDGKRHLQLVQTAVQNMFPAIDVDRVKLASIRRTLLLHFDADEELIEFRQYSIKSVPAGVSRSAKKLLQSKVPDLSKYEDISDFMLKPEQLSDSEFEGEQVELELTQDIGGRGKKRGQQTKLRLMEIGPRMTLRLVRIEEGVNEGAALWKHSASIDPL
uniref:Brix domain-containing protein n=1 Tax=Globodera rostochiensis TaxID=31243 RepID=A0A914GV08_GLORO